MKNKINIAGHSVEIIGHRDRIDKRRADADLWRNIINYDLDNTSKSVQEQSVCHEIIHQLLYKSGGSILLDSRDKSFNEDLSLEEILCNTLENVFWRFLKENTDFFS